MVYVDYGRFLVNFFGINGFKESCHSFLKQGKIRLQLCAYIADTKLWSNEHSLPKQATDVRINQLVSHTISTHQRLSTHHGNYANGEGEERRRVAFLHVLSERPF